ncbi:MAG: TrbC/VirB2 family protein [Verrucomicrobiota bacterium]
MRRYFFILLGLFYTAPVLAASWVDPMGGTNTTIQTATGGFIRNAIGYVGVLGLIAFVWAGVSWMMSGGEEKKIATAKQTMVWTVVGMFIIFAAYGIVGLVINRLSGAAGI